MGELPAGSHDMAREHRILSRLPDALAFVPRSLHLCTDPTVIGAPFQILEYRPGLVIREHLPPELAGRPEVGARLSQVLLETLAAIHAVDTEASGWTTLAGRRDSWRARSPAGASAAWRRRRTAPTRCTRTGRMAGTPPGAGRRAGAAAQRLQAEQHDPEPARSVAGRGGGLGPGHARRPAVRFRHAADLLDPSGRSAGACTTWRRCRRTRRGF